MANPEIIVGTYTGTGAAINVEIGFVPKYVEVTQVTDGVLSYYWIGGKTFDKAVAIIAANGITPQAGTPAGVKAGFQAGTAISVAAKVYAYIAVRGD